MPTGSYHSLNNKLHCSFTSALHKIEEEILTLAADTSFSKNETFILETEQDTAESVARTQFADFEHYLEKESTILIDVI